MKSSRTNISVIYIHHPLVLKCLQIMGNGWVDWSWIWCAHIPAQIQNEAVKRTTNEENKDNDVKDFSSVLLMLTWCDVFVLCVNKHVYWEKPTTLVFKDKKVRQVNNNQTEIHTHLSLSYFPREYITIFFHFSIEILNWQKSQLNCRHTHILFSFENFISKSDDAFITSIEPVSKSV